MPEATPEILSVRELTARIKTALESRFSRIWVTGELSGYRGPHGSGHIYCTLKDRDSQISMVVWRSTAQRLRFRLEEGMEVNVQGNVEVYGPRGQYQLVAERIEPKGMGELQVAFRQLCERLRAEGLFETARKRPLPRYPRGIGIVTAPTGAAVRDMLRILRRRDPRLRVVIYPARVQGDGAAQQVAAGIDYLNVHAAALGIDLIVAGRGGGSLEDLWAFNEEIVARAIFRSALPVVSAVGHEIDTTVADFVADLRAATPSEAAEIVAPELATLIAGADASIERLRAAALGAIADRKLALDGLGRRVAAHQPSRRLRELAQRADFSGERLHRMARALVEREAERVNHLAGRLESLSPLKVLARGYAVARTEAGKLVDRVSAVRAGDYLLVRVKDGEIRSVVEDTRALLSPVQSISE